jgi:hypothetical protein
VTERHRHRYEANEHYLDALQKAGLVISAITQREKLTEIVELPRQVHPWFVGVQFHPEFKSTPGTATRCSTATSRPRWTTRPRAPRPEGDRHETLRIRGRPRQALLPDRRPCVIESEQLQMDVAGQL